MLKYSVIADDQCHLKKSDWGVLDQFQVMMALGRANNHKEEDQK